MENAELKLNKKVFEEFIRKENTLAFVNQIRGMVNITSEDFFLSEEKKKELDESLIFWELYFPDINMSKIDVTEALNPSGKKSYRLTLSAYLNGFCKENCPLYNGYIKINLALYICFNEYLKDLDIKSDYKKSILVCDLISNIKEREVGNKKETNELISNWVRGVSSKNNIAILINPNTTKRQLKILIDENWSQIESLCKKYSDSRMQIRTKTKSDINDIIYESYKNGKTIAETRSFLASKDIYVDDGLISKVRTLESKKRN